jgi:uncharacterized protein involved in outer membrane biogenesis
MKPQDQNRECPMKKILLFLFLVLVAGAAFAWYKMDTLVKTGVETAGPETLNVPVTLESVSLSPLSGEVALKGLDIGQPKGFGEGSIAQIGAFDMKLRPRTLFSNHIIIDRIVVDAPVLDARRLGGKLNFQALSDGLALPPSDPETEAITLTIKSMQIKAPKVRVMNEGQGILNVDKTIEMADFQISDLGTDDQGLAPAEIARHVMAVLQPQVAQALVQAGASDKLKDLAKEAEGKLQKGLGGLIGKLREKAGDEKDDNN